MGQNSVAGSQDKRLTITVLQPLVCDLCLPGTVRRPLSLGPQTCWSPSGRSQGHLLGTRLHVDLLTWGTFPREKRACFQVCFLRMNTQSAREGKGCSGRAPSRGSHTADFGYRAESALHAHITTWEGPRCPVLPLDRDDPTHTQPPSVPWETRGC